MTPRDALMDLHLHNWILAEPIKGSAPSVRLCDLLLKARELLLKEGFTMARIDSCEEPVRLLLKTDAYLRPDGVAVGGAGHSGYVVAESEGALRIELFGDVSND